MNGGLYKFCISTIVDGRKLRNFASKGSGHVSEARVWKTGQALFHDAHGIDSEMPVIFSDAGYNTEKLLLWAILRQIESNGNGTSFKFDNVKKIRGKHERQELILRSTGKRIAAKFIRPYAICLTPDFLE
jgi:hypothetical protein